MSLKFRYGRYSALAFAATHDEPLPYYFGTCGAPAPAFQNMKDVEMDACQLFQMEEPYSCLNSIFNENKIISNHLPR